MWRKKISMFILYLFLVQVEAIFGLDLWDDTQREEHNKACRHQLDAESETIREIQPWLACTHNRPLRFTVPQTSGWTTKENGGDSHSIKDS